MKKGIAVALIVATCAVFSSLFAEDEVLWFQSGYLRFPDANGDFDMSRPSGDVGNSVVAYYYELDSTEYDAIGGDGALAYSMWKNGDFDSNYGEVVTSETYIVGNRSEAVWFYDFVEDIPFGVTNYVLGIFTINYNGNDYYIASTSWAMVKESIVSLIIASPNRLKMAEDVGHWTLIPPETPSHTVSFMNGATVVDTQDVADGGLATNVVLDVAGFMGWTNSTYVSGFDFTTPITADMTLYAWIKPYPAYIDDAALRSKFDAWVDRYHVADRTDSGISSYSQQFLMNIAPSATATLSISSISVEGTTATIVLDGGTSDLSAVNGILYLRSASSLSTLEQGTIKSTGFTFAGGKATVEVVGIDKFFKAFVGFETE